MESNIRQTDKGGRKYPIAHCPNCHRTILYSDDPRDRQNVAVRPADPSYHGATLLCAKCKTMLIVSEKPKAVRGLAVLPVIREGGV